MKFSISKKPFNLVYKRGSSTVSWESSVKLLFEIYPKFDDFLSLIVLVFC